MSESMLTIKCKMCGGTLKLHEESTIALCEYCGSQQTFPKLNSQSKENLYDRANHFRLNNDYDKAMSIYEQLLLEDNTDADTYWSIVLCRYGIEYVEEPGTRKRVPTINRTQYTSIYADADYKSAIKHADAAQRKLYEEEAKIVDEIQKGILAISQNEAPFDIFICYKESDQAGRRTHDSVLANELYHLLTQEGFKVFFSRITLEDKLGTAYEPYIFSALNSAKIMIVLGTKPEYFSAVWVKNEWSRYLALIKKGEDKILIPAYKDMDPYDLPEDFSHLQALNMNNLGFMQDLIHVIKKILIKEKSNVMIQNPLKSNVDALLKRTFMFLDDGDKKKADEYAERVLDLDPENAKAYLIKLLIEHDCNKVGELINCIDTYKQSAFFAKFDKYADKEMKQDFYQQLERAKEEKLLNELEEEYVDALKQKELLSESDLSERAENYLKLATIFQNLGNYKDAIQQGEICIAEAENAKRKYAQRVYDEALAEMKSCNDIFKFMDLARRFNSVKEYFVNAEEKEKECISLAEEYRIEHKYNSACKLIKSYKEYDIKKALSLLIDIDGYKDSDKKIHYCYKKLDFVKILKKCRALLPILMGVLVIGILYVAFNFDLFKVRILDKISNSIKGPEALIEEGNYVDAYILLNEQNSDDINLKSQVWEGVLKQTKNASGYISVSNDHIVAVTDMGKLSFDGKKIWECKNEIEMVVNSEDEIYVLDDKGNVKYLPGSSEKYLDIYLYNIISISLGDSFVAVLKKENILGVYCKGENGETIQYDVMYGYITDVVADKGHIVCLKTNGTVEAVGNLSNGRDKVDNWTDIVSIATSETHTVGLRSDGLVVSTYPDVVTDGAKRDYAYVNNWNNIIAVAAGKNVTVGLKADGTVVTTGTLHYEQNDPSEWTDIVAIAARDNNIIGLRVDGTLLSTNGIEIKNVKVKD